MPNDTLPDWEQVLTAAAQLQRILPDAILVGGSASALYAAHRIYLDFVALADHLGVTAMIAALSPFDQLYPQANGESALQQLQIQLARPLPYDLEEQHLAEYKRLDARWHDWQHVQAVCAEYATLIFDQITGIAG